jgi:thiol:disulfide interchange protein DsbA
VDVGKFNATFKSFAVESRLKRALELTAASKIDGVPALMVNGRYLVTESTANGEQRMFAVVDSLIEQWRKQAASTGPKK